MAVVVRLVTVNYLPVPVVIDRNEQVTVVVWSMDAAGSLFFFSWQADLTCRGEELSIENFMR